jgi:hypothetical protein
MPDILAAPPRPEPQSLPNSHARITSGYHSLLSKHVAQYRTGAAENAAVVKGGMTCEEIRIVP